MRTIQSQQCFIFVCIFSSLVHFSVIRGCAYLIHLDGSLSALSLSPHERRPIPPTGYWNVSLPFLASYVRFDQTHMAFIVIKPEDV